MSGVKGKSGKVTTPEAHAKRVEIARMGGNATAGRNAPPINSGGGDLSPDEIVALLPGKNPYDRVVLQAKGQFTYLDGKTREQVNGEVLANEKLTVAIMQARGDLLTREQVDERDEQIDEIFMHHLGSLVEFVGSLFPPEQGNNARARAQTWLDEVKGKISADLDGLGK